MRSTTRQHQLKYAGTLCEISDWGQLRTVCQWAKSPTQETLNRVKLRHAKNRVKQRSLLHPVIASFANTDAPQSAVRQVIQIVFVGLVPVRP